MSLSAEPRFLLDCSHVHPEDATVSRIREQLQAGVHWPAFLRLAIPHGVLPLAGRTLTTHANELLPPEIAFHLQRALTRATERNQRQWKTLTAVMDALANEDIRVLAYKGPALTMLAYGDLALRESHDLDLWVDPAETARAGRVLRSMGFQPACYDRGQPRADARGETPTEFLSADGKTVIDLQDLQVHPDYFFCPDFDEIWARRQAVTAHGSSIATLSPEDLLLALAVHGSKHLWQRLNWVADVAALLNSCPGLNWGETLLRANRWRCRRRLNSSLALVSGLYGLTLAQEPVAALERATYARRAAASCTKLLIDDAGRTFQREIARLRYQWGNIDRGSDRVRMLSNIMRHRVRNLPDTIQNRLDWQTRTVSLGSWTIRVPVPSLTMSREVDDLPWARPL